MGFEGLMQARLRRNKGDETHRGQWCVPYQQVEGFCFVSGNGEKEFVRVFGVRLRAEDGKGYLYLAQLVQPAVSGPVLSGLG